MQVEISTLSDEARASGHNVSVPSVAEVIDCEAVADRRYEAHFHTLCSPLCVPTALKIRARGKRQYA